MYTVQYDNDDDDVDGDGDDNDNDKCTQYVVDVQYCTCTMYSLSSIHCDMA